MTPPAPRPDHGHILERSRALPEAERPWYKDPTNPLVVNHEGGDFAATAMVYGAELTDLRAEVTRLRGAVEENERLRAALETAKWKLIEIRSQARMAQEKAEAALEAAGGQ